MMVWNAEHLRPWAEELLKFRRNMLTLEESSAELLRDVAEPFAFSSRNLLHYVALRRHDLRNLQEGLAALGLSSLGRAEGCVLANVDAVLRILHQLTGEAYDLPEPSFMPSGAEGRRLLQEHTDALLGSPPRGRGVRIMVTMSSEAATDYALVRDLVAAGMDCMRVNCAHDDASAWARMIEHLRRAERELGRRCRVLMDLSGPKLRTGALTPGPQVLKWRPRRDASGRVLAPARIWLTPKDAPGTMPANADACLPVPPDWLQRLAPGDRIDFRDARGAARRMHVVQVHPDGCWADSSQTAYVATGTLLVMARPSLRAEARVGELPAINIPIVLKPGDTLVLTRDPAPGGPARLDADGTVIAPARIPCTLPEVFADVEPGERIWLDDGKIGGFIRTVREDAIEVQITNASKKGAKLLADKGINLPESPLRLPALTPQDREDLVFAAAHADLVGLSFVHAPEDVEELQQELARLAKTNDNGARTTPGIVLKIETRRGFEQLPRLLLAAMRSPRVGVMIARGDLAVECGYERLAELQEEILWICEAGHVPVIWATQVLENLAKEGMPSRAEITDAAMGERAECVMLNKGPHIVEAARVLDDILRRMEGHQSKKRAMLRPLKLADRFPTEVTV